MLPVLLQRGMAMDVKAVDIAKALGISKATVSLALNNKPGVSEKTREKILKTKEMMENAEVPAVPETPVPAAGGEIKVVLISRGMHSVKNGELDLWTDVNSVFEKYARENGYTLSLLYIDFETDELQMMISACNAANVAGVIVLGTELQDGDEKYLEKIEKPLVIYDRELPTEKYSCVMINNRQGIDLAVEELIRHGNTNILYVGIEHDMYNFVSREQWFYETMAARGFAVHDGQVIRGGRTIEESCAFLRQYLASNDLPEAFLCDTYHTSIALFRVLAERGVRVPADVSVIGVDALPEYLTGGVHMTAIRVPHTERAYWAMQLLLKDIRDPSKFKMRLYMNCRLVEGDTVAER